MFSAVGLRFLKKVVSRFRFFVVEAFQYVFLYEVTQQFHVHHITGLWVGLAHKLHYQLVVVAVKVGVVAFTKHLVIPVIVPSGIKQPVCGVEMLLPENCYFL